MRILPQRRRSWEKIPFCKNEQLQVVNFIEADFAILLIFEFFLMTAGLAENGIFLIRELFPLRPLRVSAVSSSGALRTKSYR
jgi:hypothetical protein